MPSLVLALALAAALVHACWNLLIGRAEDSELATAVALVAGVLLFAPVAVLGGHVCAGAIPYLVATNVLEGGYFALLARGYDAGRASAVYPVARGSAPVLVLLVSVAAGQHLDTGEVAGVVAIAAGVVVLRSGAALSRSALTLGLATAGCIAGYTLVDKAGLRHADPLPYLELAMTVPALAYATLVVRRRSWATARRAVSPASVAAGVGVFTAYALTLAALARGTAAPVAAVRETGIVFLTAISAVVFHERIGRRQWLGALTIAVGVMAVALA